MGVLRGQRTIHQGRAKQILVRLADNGSMTTTELTEILELTHTQSVTQYLKVLREADLIQSRKRGGDGRYRLHSLTAKGRSFLDGVYEESQSQNQAEDVKVWTSEELEKEFGKPKVAGAISLKDWKKDRGAKDRKADLEKQAAELKEKNRQAEKDAANNVNLEITEDGALSF